MTALEFIVEMQWTFLLLIILVVLVVAMIRSKGFREAALNRRWKVGPSGLEVEPITPAALQAATATDEEITAVAGDDEVDVTTFRREAVEELMRTGAHWGWYQAQMGFKNPPDPVIMWHEDGSPEIKFGVGSAPNRDSQLERWLIQHRNRTVHRRPDGQNGDLLP
ncbi:hypothetical protein ACWF62_17690 [Rhodococcus sp. NPDC054953]